MHSTCEQCQKNVATVHLTEIVDKKPHEQHLCELCWQRMSAGEKSTDLAQLGIVSVEATMQLEPVSALLEPMLEQVSSDLRSTKCPDCGMSWHEFRLKGRLGCAKDYHVFEKGLIPLIERLQGLSPPEHRGKVPAGSDELVRRRRELDRLNKALREAVDSESYERAAAIRDRIREFETQEDDPK